MHWTIERQIHYPLIGEVAIAPDGNRAIYVPREPLMTDERSEFITQLYLAADGQEPRQLTFGEQSSYSPRWSPDGRYIAFVSRRSGRANLFVMHADGGEAWALTRFEKSDVTSPQWSRDGSQIAFVMSAPASEEKEKRNKARDDALVWDKDHTMACLYVLPFSVAPRSLPEARKLTDGTFNVLTFDWAKDGQSLVFAAWPTPVADTWPEAWLGRVDCGWEVAPQDFAARPPTRLGSVAAYWPAPRVSPDGTLVACVVSNGKPRWAFDARIALFPIDGGEPRILHDTPDSQPELVGWTPDGSAVIVDEVSGVGSQLMRLPVDGSAPQLIDGPAMFTFPSLSPNGAIALVSEDFEQPNAIDVIDTQGELKRLAKLPMPSDWPDAPLPRAEVIQWQAPDGSAVEGIVSYPMGEQSGPAPLVVIVHGGPTGVFQRSYLGTPVGYGQICAFAERGYATLRVNPRGSSGYGRDFRFANDHDWGFGDFEDIMSGVDLLIERGIADAKRLAIMGWSYGGFMTSWAITQTDRFKAACVGAAVTNLSSFNGTADIPSFIPDYFGGDFWDNDSAYRKHSPMAHVGRVTTPALIQHGENDIRVPLSQGREFYNALRRRGIPTELVVYPRQGHIFEEPRMIIDARKRVLEWLERFI